MRRKPILPIFLWIGVSALGQTPTPAPKTSDLNTVLAQMDEGAKRFKAGQADMTTDAYEPVTKTHDIKTGKIFARKKNSSREVAIHLLTPHPLQVLIKGGKATIYNPKINETTERSIGDPADAASVTNMASPFGVTGEDLKKDYDVKLIDWETVDGVKTAKLELVPHKEGAKKLFSKIILWIDPARDVAVQQQRFGPDPGVPGVEIDYQLAHYKSFSDKASDDSFKIKKNGE